MTSSSLLDAGREAVTERRWADALEFLGRAELVETLAASDLELLATAALLRGESATSVEALSRAYTAYLAVEDPLGAARCAGWLSLNLIEMGDFTNSVSWAARAMRVVDGVGEPGALAGFVRLPLAVAQLGGGSPADAVHLFAEVLSIAEKHADHELAALARMGLGNSLLEVGDLARGFDCFDLCVAAIEAGEVAPVPAGVIFCTVVSDAVMAFDLDRATAWVTVFDGWCREQPQLVTFSGRCRSLEGTLLLIRGAWAEASVAAELALARWRAGDYRASWGAPYLLAEVARLRGAFHSAEESYRRAGESGWEPQPGLALLHLAAGHAGRAQDEIRRSVAGADLFTRRYLLPSVVEIEVAAGDLAAARRALELLRDAGRTASVPLLEATIGAAEARVQLAEGDAHAAWDSAHHAAAAWDRLGARYESARCHVLAGRALRSLGEGAAAQSAFDRARDVFLMLHADPAAAELAELRGDRRPGTLTVRELEVLRLVSTGLTNRAIAANLSLSEKTVARHLANIFAKLGLSTRAAATAYAYENGLV